MSQDFMDPELFADFIIEAKEHLETIEPNLLELEKTPDNLSLLNEIFRPMHSLKGASGFLGLNKMNSLAHKAENILDELRKGAMAVNSEIMDIILASTDALRQMIDNLENTNTEGDVDTSQLIATLDALMAGELPAPAKAGPDPEAATPEVSEPESGAAPAPSVGETAAVKSTEPDGQSQNGTLKRQAGNIEEWLASREKLPPYALTAFGEGHLRDFIEEAGDNISNLSDGLLILEKHPADQKDVVNDLFRYFHNLKGNSGIIAFHELNGLTHESETLLNALRKDASDVAPALVDLLLLVVDALEALIFSIDPASGTVTPFDISEILDKLRQAVAGEGISLPDSLMAAGSNGEAGLEEKKETAGQGTAGGGPLDSADIEDLQVFRSTVEQQFAHIDEALAGMRRDGGNRDYADAMYRSLVTVQNSCSFMGLEEIKQYAQRTAGIVDQGRTTGLDFSIMADLLEQECAIIRDMIKDTLGKGPEIPEDGNNDSEESGADRKASPEPVQGDAQLETAPGAPEAAGAPAGKAKGKAKKSTAQDEGAKETSTAKTEKEPEGKSSPAQESTAVPAAPSVSRAPATEPEGNAPAKPASPMDQKAAVPAPAAPAKVPAPAQPPAGAAKPTAPAQQNDHASKSSSTIRVDHEKLDHLMNLIGELIINRNRYSMLARQLESSANVDVGVIAQNLTETTYSMARISDELQDTIMKVRMVPVASVFSRFPRLVRDLSRKSGKEVELIMEGEDTELDKSVVEVIGDPLVHLIRNSVDHGIESEETRKERGKPPKGSVWLRAFYKGNSVAIEIEDDGKGIDPDKMREVAVRKGIISHEDAKLLDDREAMELIFAPGFSSAEVITDISGRGVGMDVVRTNIKNLKGSISITSEVGKGTKFTLSLPLTLAIIDALMVNVDDQMYAIPLDAVSETTKIEAKRLTDVKGRKAVTLRGEVLGIVSLGELLGLPNNIDKHDMLQVVVIHDNERRLGLVVDRLLERQEIVIKPLGAYLGDLKGISGATIMGDGSVILILDPHEIYALSSVKGG